MNKSIAIQGEGVALFRAPNRMTVDVNEELAIVLVAEPDTCAVVVFHPASPIKNLHDMLESVSTKLTLGRPSYPGPIRAKLFGLSREHEGVMRASRDWLRANGIDVTARDLGRNVFRKLVVECATGEVGVGYAENYAPRGTPFVDEGSSRQRNEDPLLPANTAYGTRILILTGNPVLRLLARQVVEELDNFVGIPADDPEAFLARTANGDFPYSFVLLFEDAAGPSLTKRWLEVMQDRHPAVHFLWSGSRPPKPGRGFRFLLYLPPLDPESITAFKKAFHGAVYESAPAQNATVLQFPKARKRR